MTHLSPPHNVIIAVMIISVLALILYQIWRDFSKDSILEGMSDGDSSFQDYDTKSSDGVSTLAHKNAGNISVLRDDMVNVRKLKDTVRENKTKITEIQTQINDLAEAQNDYAGDLVGTDEPDISGAV